MDHRWDRDLRDAQTSRTERERYEAGRVADDPEVERRDRAIEQGRRVQRSPWEIGAAHWDQRDLYTRNARTDDGGYGEGPRVHPEEGSYAYARDRLYPESSDVPVGLYAREAWPIEHYGYAPPRRGHARALARPTLRERVRNAIGLGPKVWRSDARILDDVSDALAAHGRLDAREIEVSVRNAEVTLEGSVPDRDQRRLAEDLAASCTGVRDVHNRLRVARDEPPLFAARAQAF